MVKTYPVVIHPDAELEMLNIYNYIFMDSPQNAEKWLNALMKVCTDIGTFPLKHPEFKWTSEPSRQMIFNKNIRIIYTIMNDQVIIIHCMRCEQNIDIL